MGVSSALRDGGVIEQVPPREGVVLKLKLELYSKD